MPTYIRRFLPSVALVLLTTLAPGAFAKLVTVSFQGTLHTADYGSISDQNKADPYNLLPFPLPTDGTTFTLEATFDIDAPLSQADPAPFLSSPYTLNVPSVTGKFNGVPFFHATTNNQIAFANDSAPLNPGVYYDNWDLDHDSTDASGLTTQFYVHFSSEFTQIPNGPLTSDNLVIPPLQGWQSSSIAFTVFNPDTPYEEGGIFADITSISVTSPVPLPASVWLFGSALVGLAGLKRQHRFRR